MGGWGVRRSGYFRRMAGALHRGASPAPRVLSGSTRRPRSLAAAQVRECHGNSEVWQCALRRCPGRAESAAPTAETDESRSAGPTPPPEQDLRWPAPPGFRFSVDDETCLAAPGPPQAAAAGAGAGFESNWPTCVHCGGKARPAILMFGDAAWHDDDEQERRWLAWQRAVMGEASRRGSAFIATIVEVGAGGNVTTVRNLAEDLLEQVSDKKSHYSMRR